MSGAVFHFNDLALGGGLLVVQDKSGDFEACVYCERNKAVACLECCAPRKAFALNGD